MALATAVFMAVTGISIARFYDKTKSLLSGKEIATEAVAGDVVEPFISKGKVKITLDGKEMQPIDMYDNLTEPFIYNGTAYLPARVISRAFDKNLEWDPDSKQVIMDTDIGEFWQGLVHVLEIYTRSSEIYWPYIDDEIMEKVDYYVEKYGTKVLFQGLRSVNPYSRYYCINRLVEYYNDDKVRGDAIQEIRWFLDDDNETIRQGAEFALSVLTKEFDSPYIAHGADGVKVFALFNDYSGYGSYNELWIIRDDKLSKFYSLPESHTYIDTTEPILFSPDKDKIAVQTCTRRKSSINIIDISNGKIGPELMGLAVEKVAMDHQDYDNTYPDGRYCWGGNLKWIDNNTLEFEAGLAYNYGEIIEKVIVKYNDSDDSLEYISQR
jgi:hypothetical protein